jgi:RTX calcium-binding nonapeptide repeat (4 copies)
MCGGLIGLIFLAPRFGMMVGAATGAGGKMADNDRLEAGRGDDVSLRGGEGDDLLDGGPGFDAECLGANDPDVDAPDVDTIQRCE